MDEDLRYYLEREIDQDMVQLTWAPGSTSPRAPVVP